MEQKPQKLAHWSNMKHEMHVGGRGVGRSGLVPRASGCQHGACGEQPQVADGSQ